MSAVARSSIWVRRYRGVGRPEQRATWRAWGLSVWVAVAGLGSAGCQEQAARTAAPSPPSVQAKARWFTRQLSSEVRTLDPAIAADAASLQVVDDLFESLLSVSADGELVAGMATAWEPSEDGRVWTFTLRPDARWSNGAPLTAQDFVYAWRRLVDPKTRAARAYLLAPVMNANEIRRGKLPARQLGVTAPDPSTLVVRLAVHAPHFLELVSHPFTAPLYAPAVIGWGREWLAPGRLVSNGAYRLREHPRGGAIVLAKNPYYWGESQLRLQGVRYLPPVAPNVVRAGFAAGRIDYLDTLAVSDIGWAKARGAEPVRAAHFGTVLLAFDCTRPPFAGNRDLRLALNLAIDREVLSTRIAAGTLAPADSLVPPLPGYPRQVPAWSRVPSQAERSRLAREHYSKAGFSRLRPLRLELTFPAARADLSPLLEAVAAMWYKALGADVRLRQESGMSRSAAKIDSNTDGLALLSQASAVPVRDPAALLQLFRSNTGTHARGCVSDKFEAFMRVAATEVDPKARYKFLQRAEALLNYDAAYVPLALAGSHRLLQPYVQGFASNAMDRHLTRHLSVHSP